jgi:cytochrome c-type biogenesis protein CcmH/NrfF
MRSSFNHDDGAGHAFRFRPEELKDPNAVRLASRLMHNLVCLCGGCQRETLYDCKCSYAAQERELVLRMLAEKDLASESGRTAAYDTVVDAFVRKYGGEKVLVEPRNQLAWILPYAAILGGLGLLVTFGRRWVRRGRANLAAAPTAAGPAAVADVDDEYADKLDDELRDVD